jgi:hypothetical protein
MRGWLLLRVGLVSVGFFSSISYSKPPLILTISVLFGGFSLSKIIAFITSPFSFHVLMKAASTFFLSDTSNSSSRFNNSKEEDIFCASKLKGFWTVSDSWKSPDFDGFPGLPGMGKGRFNDEEEKSRVTGFRFALKKGDIEDLRDWGPGLDFCIPETGDFTAFRTGDRYTSVSFFRD